MNTPFENIIALLEDVPIEMCGCTFTVEQYEEIKEKMGLIEETMAPSYAQAIETKWGKEEAPGGVWVKTYSNVTIDLTKEGKE